MAAKIHIVNNSQFSSSGFLLTYRIFNHKTFNIIIIIYFYFRFDWSGVSMSYTFTGATYTSIQLSDHGNMYTVYINNKLYSILNTTNAVNYNYAVAQNLDPTQSYTVKLVRPILTA